MAEAIAESSTQRLATILTLTMERMTDHSNPSIISAQDLTRIYPMGATNVIGLSQVNLEIRAAELVVLKGNSGSGKSTLLALLAGLDRPTSGRLRVAGYDLLTASQAELVRYRRNVVGVVFQSFNLLPTLTVLENICLPALLAGKAADKIRLKAMDLVDWLNLRSRQHHRPAELSGGEMQRTAIARSLINDPSVILADEPTGNLDSHNGQAVIELLAELNRRSQRTVIIATHSTIADHYATSSLCLKDGQIVDATCDG